MTWLELAPLRRAALFGFAIGMPVAVGAALAMPIVALPAAIAGLLLSFADDPKELAARLRALVLVAAGMGLGAVTAFITRDAPIMLWSTALIGGTCVGAAVVGGGLNALAARDGAIAFAIATVLPWPTPGHALFLAAVAVLIVVARSIDHACFGPLPPLSGGQVLARPGTFGRRARFALSYGFAATMALWVGRTFASEHAPWIVISTLVVMQPDAAASHLRVLERSAGAALGVAAAWATLLTTRAVFPLVMFVVVISTALPHHFKRRYWLHTALIAYAVLLMYALGARREADIHHLLVERLVDMLAGCAIALAGTFAAIPRKAVSALPPSPAP